MSLYDIVQHVNRELYPLGYDYSLGYTTNNICDQVSSELSEGMITYIHPTPDQVIVEDLDRELERRIKILTKQREVLNTYVVEE